MYGDAVHRVDAQKTVTTVEVHPLGVRKISSHFLLFKNMPATPKKGKKKRKRKGGSGSAAGGPKSPRTTPGVETTGKSKRRSPPSGSPRASRQEVHDRMPNVILAVLKCLTTTVTIRGVVKLTEVSKLCFIHVYQNACYLDMQQTPNVPPSTVQRCPSFSSLIEFEYFMWFF